jgi:putative SOS response-associated peptidase YedK
MQLLTLKDYMMKRKYWISTEGKRPFVFALLTQEPSDFITKTYLVKSCNYFTYWLFKNFKINLLAKDKFAWLKH